MRKVSVLAAVTGVLVAVLVAPASAAPSGKCALKPSRIHYSADVSEAKRENRFLCRHGLIDASGGPTGKGIAWMGLTNGHTPAARTRPAARAQLTAYRRLGLWDPNKIEYADDELIALRQFKQRYARGLIKPDGGWTQRRHKQSRRA